MKKIVFMIILIISIISLKIVAGEKEEDERILRASLQTKAIEILGTVYKRDSNNDSKIDYILAINKAGKKIAEAFDYNNDGFMDDFTYYDNGIMIRREVDTNYDDMIDIWVYLREGIYVERIERDSDFDGIIDYEKQYGKVKE